MIVEQFKSKNIRHYYSTTELANGARLLVDYIYLFNVSQMIADGARDDNGVLVN